MDFSKRFVVNYLLWGLGVLIALYLVRRFLGDHQQEKSHQYSIFEKRFRLERRTFRSQWGKGMGSRFSLEGEFRGYPVRLYSHYQGEGRGKKTWTSLTFETLFTGELAATINAKEGDPPARFKVPDGLLDADDPPNNAYAFHSSDSGLWPSVWTSETDGRLSQLEATGKSGSICVSKGFLEYRESSEMDTEESRLRFQIAILLLADLADALSLYAKRIK